MRGESRMVRLLFWSLSTLLLVSALIGVADAQFVPFGTKYVQLGTKLVPAGGIGDVVAGVSVALSADGNTALIGGPVDNNFTGAAWVFMRKGGAWLQQKLVWQGPHGQGYSIALSGDGKTALIGAGNGLPGGWVFVRNGDVWTQQGKLVVSDPTVYLGKTVSLS